MTVWLVWSCMCLSALAAPTSALNVLLIYMDDLRWSDDGTELMPGQDKLRSQAFSFTGAHTHYAMCNPSRAALLTGRRPDSTHVWGNSDEVRNFAGDLVTLPQAFMKAGYETISLSKIFHNDDEFSWSVPPWHPKFNKTHDQAVVALPPSVDELDDDRLPDGRTAVKANETLEQLAAGQKPWFLAVGFKKPHLPFVFPERFLARYPNASAPLAKNPYAPAGAPRCSMMMYDTLKNNFEDMKAMCATENPCDPFQGPIPDSWARHLRTGYHAAATWSDSHVLGLLGKMEELGLMDSTVVAYVSDHGWKLGEHASWEKETLWQDDSLTPFMLSVPGHRDGPQDVKAIVEHIDLAPTLAELCGVEADGQWEGASLLPLLQNRATAVKSAAFAQQTKKGECAGYSGKVMGSAVMTLRWKYAEWPKWQQDSQGCWGRNWERSGGSELYDLEADPNENVNVVEAAENAQIVEQLRTMLRAQFAEVPCNGTAPPVSPCDQAGAATCGGFTTYSDCHDCMWEHSDSLVEAGCDWEGHHGDIIKKVCPTPSPAPSPPSPSPPSPPAPSPDQCLAAGGSLCGTFVTYEQCHDCLWQHSDDLAAAGCDWDNEHSKIMKAVCPPKVRLV